MKVLEIKIKSLIYKICNNNMHILVCYIRYKKINYIFEYDKINYIHVIGCYRYQSSAQCSSNASHSLYILSIYNIYSSTTNSRTITRLPILSNTTNLFLHIDTHASYRINAYKHIHVFLPVLPVAERTLNKQMNRERDLRPWNRYAPDEKEMDG